ncbi:MAG: NAD(P)-dependent oxidoreductase [bacterium]
MNILLTTKLPVEGFESISENHNLIIPQTTKFSQKELEKYLPETDILIPTFDYKITEEMMNMAPKLQLITNFGVGFNNIDIVAATARGIVVTNTPEPVIIPTAEQAFALMLAICHRTAELDRKMRLPNSPIKIGVMNNLGLGLYGKTLGIIGLGNIGKAVAERAIACGMKIVYHNRRQMSNEIEDKYKAAYCEDITSLLTQSDIVSLHMPYTPESHHLIDKQRLSEMKKGAVLINTSRGACVDEAALIQSLQSGHLFGAALDVFEFEPNISPELFELDNVILSPHIGTGTIDGRIAMCHCCSDNIINYLNNSHDRLNKVN